MIAVQEGGVAYASGFRVGDQIRTIGGVSVDIASNTLDEIAAGIRSRGGGTGADAATGPAEMSLEVEVDRDGLL